jgi:putative membrane protein insertion efficiency factor
MRAAGAADQGAFLAESLTRLPLRAALAVVAGYKRWISPLLPPACRFQPTCSEYAYEALRRHGLRRGGWMALKRIGRCHPLHPGGSDPVR